MKQLYVGSMLVLVFLLACIGYSYSQSNAIIELIANEDGTGGEWFWVATPTARVITATSGPTQTPWIITATSSDEPTQETFTPTPSLTPTVTSTPTPPGCQLINNSGGTIRVRNLPSTTGTTTLGYIEYHQYIFAEAYYIGPTYKWWKLYWDENTYGWSADFYEEVTSCGNIPYEDPFQ